MQLQAQSFSGLIEWLGPVAPVVGTVECHPFFPLAETKEQHQKHWSEHQQDLLLQICR